MVDRPTAKVNVRTIPARRSEHGRRSHAFGQVGVPLRKPVSAKTVGRTITVSRHLPAGDNKAMDNKPRKISLFDKVCVALCEMGDDLMELKLFAHRLRSVHTQYDDDTVSPFPLHELEVLGKAVISRAETRGPQANSSGVGLSCLETSRDLRSSGYGLRSIL
ncbi:hypothetical protein QIH77_02880 [Bradyrhizobium diazoefficiens]|uniref:hypothetical protein n=1 Tax=Bradyrhizobium diazoefficiens TaxID=1355477 RepID=UPI00272AD13D|nr:hypothetical protein [Bradyrhizobium diazoefficiens]WLA74198.1 hypothetical protein QIH77_02880 [Bradyrhizobium diazoefficiens]